MRLFLKSLGRISMCLNPGMTRRIFTIRQYCAFSSNFSDPSEFSMYKTPSVFTSKYYEIRTSEIFELLKSNNMEFKEIGQEIVIKYCPFCPKPTHDKPDNLYKLNVKRTSGCYYCFRCGAKGSWFDFRSSIYGTSSPKSEPLLEIEPVVDIAPLPNSQSLSLSYEMALSRYNTLLEQKLPKSIQYLTGKNTEKGERWLSLETLQHYKVGIGYEKFRNTDNQYISL